MNRKSLFAALGCALLAFSMLGCNALQTTNHLRSIQLSTSNTSATPPGTLDLMGIGGTIQLYAWGNYSSGSQVLLDNRNAAYQIVLTPGSGASTGELGDPNATPPGTVQLSPNGLLTAVTPFACTWANSAQPPATTPAWGIIGTYTVTATYSGFTSPPVYVAVASEAGIWSTTNPTGECGPQPTH